MTTYDIYRYIFIGAAVLCGVMLVVTVLLFIFLKIPKVISDLSGATARKAIKNIREQNAAGGDKRYKPSAFNEARGRLTDKITPSGNVVQQYQAGMGFGAETTKIATQELAGETAVLDDTGAGETSVLDNIGAGETSVLDNIGAGETSVLDGVMYADETSVLNEPVAVAAETSILDAIFTIEYDITYIHSDEIIGSEVG